MWRWRLEYHAENSALNHTEINDILKYIPIDRVILNCKNIHNITVFTVFFDQINDQKMNEQVMSKS